MSATACHLDLTRLEKVRHVGTRIVARCPACAEDGGDRGGHHLAILPSGRFACAACPGDSAHRRRVFALVGVSRACERDPEQDRRWRDGRARERLAEQDRRRLVDAARARRAAIIARHPWDPADVWEDSPQRIDCDLVESDPRHFLDALFPSDAVLWTGEVHESGQAGRHAGRWRTCREWCSASAGERVGPMVAPAIWQPGTVSRAAANVAAAPFTVLDFDGFDGAKPETPEQLCSHLAASLALIRWLREGLCWQLAAILWTGGKSLHAWFHSPAPAVLESLRITAGALGLDAGLIGRPEHPCRMPGHRHANTGNLSRVRWLQLPQPVEIALDMRPFPNGPKQLSLPHEATE
ncbi:MAG: hypothetical protein NTW21_37110 [Verrucomicrobia bacterium]|nr:hypothetical protein [Verrucomicrobiota bacterium]